MNDSIVSAVSKFLTPELVSRMASMVGISDTALARQAVGAAAPAILSGMASLASKPEGAQRLANAIAEQSPRVLDGFAHAISGSGGFANIGQNVLTSLFGGRSFSSLASAVGKFTGIGDGPVNSLLGMLTPAILGVLGREAGAGATGLTQLLSSQKDQIAAAMPTGLTDALRTSGFLGQASPVASLTDRATDTYRATREQADTMARPMSGPASRSMHWGYWALPLVALAGLLWYLLGSEGTNPPGSVAPTAIAPPTATQGAPVGGDLGRQITTALDSLNTALQGVKDRTLTADAASKLQQTNSEIERLSGLASRLPVEARDRLAETLKSASARLKSTLDTVSALPGAPADVKATIASLQTKVDGLVTLAQASASPGGRVAYIATTPRGALSISIYINRDVYNTAGEKIGAIKDLVVGPEGRIDAAVMGVGGFLGIGEKDVAVMFSSIRVTQGDKEPRFVVDATKDALKEAPIYRETNSATHPSGNNTQK
jgi:hypothetical protein